MAGIDPRQHTMVAAALRQAFQRPDHAAARMALLHVADRMRARWPKLVTSNHTLISTTLTDLIASCQSDGV